jgi:hypothetical protein
MVQVLIQVLPLSPPSAPSPMLRIYAVLCILFAVKSHPFKSYFKEMFLCFAIKKDSDGLVGEGGVGCLLAQKVPGF